MEKQVAEVFESGSQHWVGDGFPVRNLFPSNGVNDRINPFLMLDYAGPAEFPPSDQPRGVGEHPHRGFETVTIVYQGAVAHRDSTGSAGVIEPGDVQWMTAAAGIVHEEIHEREFTRRGGTLEMVQLWVNLPKAHKMAPPGYQGILAARIPAVELGGGSRARIIAGDWNGTRGPARTFTPINVFDLRLASSSRVTIPLPHGHAAAVVLLHGGVSIGGLAQLEGEAKIALLSTEGESISITARTESTLVILSGQPIDEPVASLGPFVMNTQEELREAVQDYRSGRMGRLS